MKRLIILSVIALFMFILFVIVPVDHIRAEQQNTKKETDREINIDSNPSIQEINTDRDPDMETDQDDYYYEEDDEADRDGWC